MSPSQSPALRTLDDDVEHPLSLQLPEAGDYRGDDGCDGALRRRRRRQPGARPAY